MIRFARTSLLPLMIIAAPSPAQTGDGSGGFTVLDFRDALSGNFLRWREVGCGTGPEFEVGEPVVLTYRIDEEFFEGFPQQMRDDAHAAILNALASWSEATGGFIVFVESPWLAVENRDSTRSI